MKFIDQLPTDAAPCVTIYISLEHESETAREKNAIRLKNARQEVEKAMENDALPEDLGKSILTKLDEITSSDDRWDLRGHTLAIFAAGDKFYKAYLSKRVDDRLHIGDHFYILPTLRAEAAGESFAVLDVDQERANLIYVHGKSTNKLELLGGGVAAVPPDEHERSDQLQFHTTGGGEAQFHGQGQAEHAAEERLRRWIDEVSEKLYDELYGSQLPVICAADEKIFGHLREENEYEHLHTEDCLPAATDDGLSDDAWEKARGWIRSRRDERHQQQLEKVQAAIAHGQGDTKLGSIRSAAEQGKVDVILLADTLDDSAGGHRIRLEITPDQKTINEAALFALKTGANVFVVPEENMPDNNKMMAAYRY